MPLLSLIFLFVSFQVYSSRSHLTCSKSGTHIAAINGVNINWKKFRSFKSETIKLMSLDIEKTNVDAGQGQLTVNAYHNASFDLLSDGYETWKLYLRRLDETNGRHVRIDLIVSLFMWYLNDISIFNKHCDVEDLKVECNELLRLMSKKTTKDLGEITAVVDRQFKANKKIIFLSHSAGALFVDTVRDYIKEKYQNKYQYTSHLALARPFITNHDNAYELNFDRDEILKTLKFLSPNDVPDFNVSQMFGCTSPNGSDIAVNHDYIFCYLGPVLVDPNDKPILADENFLNARNLVSDSIYRVAGMLENNDEKCCNKQKNGKVWLNGGGFISKKSSAENVFIDSTSSLCGEGVLKNGSVNVNTVLDGVYNLAGNFNIRETTMTPTSSLISNDSSQRLRLENLTLDGGLEFLTNINLLDVDIKGKVKFKYNGSVEQYIQNSDFEFTGDIPSYLEGTHSLGIGGSKIKGTFNVVANKIRLVNLQAPVDFSLSSSHSLSEINIENATFSNKAFLNFYPNIQSYLDLKDISSSGNMILNVRNMTALTVDASDDVSIDSTKSVRMYRSNISEKFSFIGTGLNISDSSIEGNLATSNTCSYYDLDILGSKIGEGNSFLNAASISSNGTTRYSVTSTTINGNKCECNDPEIPCGPFSVVMRKDLSGFTGQGIAIINASIGSGVTVNPGSGGTDISGDNASIADGTSITPPVYVFNCGISGSIGPDYSEWCSSWTGILNIFKL